MSNLDNLNPKKVCAFLVSPGGSCPRCSPPTERQQANAQLANTLTKSIRTMLTYTSSERGRSVVPPITVANGISPFPIKITVKVGGIEVEPGN